MTTPSEQRRALMADLESIFQEQEDSCLYFDEFEAGLKARGIKLANLNTGEYVGMEKFRRLQDKLDALKREGTNDD